MNPQSLALAYRHESGVLSYIRGNQVLVDLGESKQRIEIGGEWDDVQDVKALGRGRKIVCSWISRNPKARFPSYILADGVEEIDKWQRPSVYKPRKFTETPRDVTAKNAEFVFKDLLLQAGVRAEHATPYEDQRCGVDVWALLFVQSRWTWFPLDLTFCDVVKDTRDGKGTKLEQCSEQGVIPVQLYKNMKATPENVVRHTLVEIAKYRPQLGRPLLDRLEAMSNEVHLAPRKLIHANH